MKKIISILLAVLVVFSMLAVTASAAKAPTISAKANVSSPKVGDTVKVTVSTSKNSKMCSATLSVLYDSEYFKVVSKTGTEAFSLEQFGVSEGKVVFLGVTNSTIKDSATELFTVEFKVLKTGGKITVSADEIYVADGDTDVDVTSKVSPVTLTLDGVCNHSCHKGGISGFFWSITNFFNKLFGKNQYCVCGVAHY